MARPKSSKSTIEAAIIVGRCTETISDRISKPGCPKTPSMKGMPSSTRLEKAEDTPPTTPAWLSRPKTRVMIRWPTTQATAAAVK